MNQKLLSLSGPITPPAISPQRLLELSDEEAGLAFLVGIANRYGGLTFGDVIQGLNDVSMGKPCGSWYSWNCIKSFGSDVASGTKNVFDYVGEKSGDGFRLLFDEDVICGVTSIMSQTGKTAKDAAPAAATFLVGPRMGQPGCPPGEGGGILDSFLSLFGYAAKQEATKSAGFASNQWVVIGGVLVGGFLIGAILKS